MICLTTTEAFDLRVLLLSINAAVGKSQTNSDPTPESKVKMLTHQALSVLKTAEGRKQ